MSGRRVLVAGGAAVAAVALLAGGASLLVPGDWSGCDDRAEAVAEEMDRFLDRTFGQTLGAREVEVCDSSPGVAMYTRPTKLLAYADAKRTLLAAGCSGVDEYPVGLSCTVALRATSPRL